MLLLFCFVKRADQLALLGTQELARLAQGTHRSMAQPSATNSVAARAVLRMCVCALFARPCGVGFLISQAVTRCGAAVIAFFFA